MPSLKTIPSESSSKDLVAYLITEIFIKDELGQEIVDESAEPIEYQVFCNEKSISQSEFSVTFTNGLKAELVLEIDQEEYDGQEIIRFNDITYSIYRTFVNKRGDIELYCKLRVGV